MTLTQEIINSPVIERTNKEVHEILKESDFLPVYRYPVGIKIYMGELGYWKFRRIIERTF